MPGLIRLEDQQERDLATIRRIADEYEQLNARQTLPKPLPPDDHLEDAYDTVNGDCEVE